MFSSNATREQSFSAMKKLKYFRGQSNPHYCEWNSL